MVTVVSRVCRDMDRINGLPDELLVKILSFLPTKVAVKTSVLSKRWECLWFWLPKLEFTSGYSSVSRWEKLRCFLDRKLPLHRAPVIQRFSLAFISPQFNPTDIKLWLVIAVFRGLRELKISYVNHPGKRNILPSSLYNCKSLLTLELTGTILFDVPSMVCLPSLKTLKLHDLVCLNGESLGRLLSICPVLETLLVWLGYGVKMGKITVMVPSLLSLSLIIPYKTIIDGLEIKTPSLKYLKLDTRNNEVHSFSSETMPKLEEAYVDVRFNDIKSLLGLITSVKRLTLCSKIEYGNGVIFKQLEHLKLCDCSTFSLNLLTLFLKDSPGLRVLDIIFMPECAPRATAMVLWNQPNTVPECLLSSLQTFKWSGYFGRVVERHVAVYILENARRLNNATILSSNRFTPKLNMLKELSNASRASTSCQLLFR